MVRKINKRVHVNSLCSFYKKNRRGQLKVQQMIFMLLAVSLFFILVGLIFLSVRLRSIKETATNLNEKNAMLLVSKLANSPEFSCGHVFGGSRINCIDFDKVMILKDKKQYANSGFWGVAKIEIRKIYPNDRGNISCQKDNYPGCGLITIMDKKVNAMPPSSNFIALCRKESNEKMIYDKCELAILMISSEDKRT